MSNLIAIAYDVPTAKNVLNMSLSDEAEGRLHEALDARAAA